MTAIPNLEALLASRPARERERAWWNANRAWLSESYPGRVVCVVDEKVVFAASSLEELESELIVRGLVSHENCWTEFIERPGKRWVL